MIKKWKINEKNENQNEKIMKNNEVLISSLWLPEILLILESKARKNVTLHFYVDTILTT